MHEVFEKINEALKELESDRPEKRQKAAIKLRNFNHSKVGHHLVKVIKDDSHTLTRISAIQSLAWIGDKSHIKVILDLALNESDKLVKLTAIESLATFKDTIAIDTLMKIVNRSDDKDVIKSASLSIQIIQGVTPDWSLDRVSVVRDLDNIDNL